MSFHPGVLATAPLSFGKEMASAASWGSWFKVSARWVSHMYTLRTLHNKQANKQREGPGHNLKEAVDHQEYFIGKNRSNLWEYHLVIMYWLPIAWKKTGACSTCLVIACASSQEALQYATKQLQFALYEKPVLK